MLLFISCDDEKAKSVNDINVYAEEYVYLTLSLGNHNAYYVDAYFGADSVRNRAENDSLGLKEIEKRFTDLYQNLASYQIQESDSTEIYELRKKRLLKHIESGIAYSNKLRDSTMTFEDEVKKLYGYHYKPMELDEIQSILDGIDALLPGSGDISSRWKPVRDRFRIPLEMIDTLFMTSISDAQDITLQKVDLPQTETFKVEYVTGEPWSAYNWYKGDYYSLIQVNTDADVFIDRAIDLAAHEGYPGHHTYQCLMEKHFIKDQYWPEYTIYPLFSPTSLLSEGLAEYGVNMVFGEDRRYAYERDVLMAKAGMDTTGFDLYKKVSQLVGKLDHAGLYAASAYINGNLDREETKDFLVKYVLMSEEKAEQRVDFIERFGAYIINYTLGIELVADYIDKVSIGNTQDMKWAVYVDILSNPYLPSDLELEGE